MSDSCFALHPRKLLGALTGAVLCCASSPASAQSGGIEIFAGETLFESGTRVSLSWLATDRSELYAGSSSISNPLDASRFDQRLVLGLDHGLTGDLTLSALVPVVNNDFESNAGGVSAQSLGDISLIAKQRLLRVDGPQRSFSMSLIGGLEMPTGDDDATDNGVLVPPTLQPGSGAWNPFAALAATRDFARWRFDGVLFYKLNAEGAQDYQKGDFFSADVSGKYRFLHRPYPGPSASARLGLQWRNEGSAEKFGSGVTNTGASALMLRGGLGLHPSPPIDLSLSLDVPIYEDVEGTQLGVGARLVLAMGWRF